jgi:hapalindole biogenesis HpiC1 cyclase-like protein/PEP-CTERM motif-containing protein
MIVVMAAGALSLAVSANPVAVSNPGFELPALNPTGWVSYIPGWTTGPAWIPDSVGVFYPSAAQYPGGIPDGNNVAFSKGPFIAQILTSTLLPSTIYTLTVDVGYRLDDSSGRFTGFTILLLAGNTVIASSSTGTPAAGNWISAVAAYTSSAADPLAGLPLQILLTVNNPYPYQVNFDNVHLDATALPPPLGSTAPIPEPGTLVLVGSGLLGFLRRRVRS